MFDLCAQWPAPSNVMALTTKRTSGFSVKPYDSNNFGLHVDDNPKHVIANRIALTNRLRLPNIPEWLEQTHSTIAVVVEEDANRKADAAITRQANYVLAVMSADCQPILLCNKQGTEIAAIHAGWKGLVNGIIENTVASLQSKPSEMIAWLGPAICQSCFEVGNEVGDNYISKYPFTVTSFKSYGKKLKANLPLLAKQILYSVAITSVYQSNICTFERKNEFYSYRRDQQTGRMASLIWFNNVD